MPGPMLDKLDVATLIAEVIAIRERCDRILDVLMPDGAATECPHPPDKVIDDSSFGEEKYRCGHCGAESTTPFHTS